MRQRETQDAFKQIVTQTAQKPFGHHPDIDIDEILKPAIDENKGEENTRKRKEIFDLGQIKTDNFIWRTGPADRFVDDHFRQVE